MHLDDIYFGIGSHLAEAIEGEWSLAVIKCERKVSYSEFESYYYIDEGV